MTDWSRRPQVPEPERDPQRPAGGEPARPDVPRDLSNAASVPNETKVTSAANEQDQRRGGEPKVTAATTKSSTERSSARDGDGNGSHRAPKGGSNLGAVLAALVLGLLLGAFAMSLLSSDDEGGGDTFAGVIDADRYQAVILSNDKVYFGRIEDVSDDFFQLDNAFFLRETRASEDAEPDRSLLPVNREIHAPDNTMLIRKDEVVLVENLAEDSPILTEINRQLGDE